MIEELQSDTVKYIKSQQYIQSIYSITKELLENSLDANSTIIKIIIDDDNIRVEDNGMGIEDMTKLGEWGCTSKEYTTYQVIGYNTDNQNQSCGYRGVALCAIRNICDLEVTSKAITNDIGYKKSFYNNEITKCSRTQGTTVVISNIFKNCPIRRKQIQKNQTQNIKKICDLIEGYCMIYKAQILLKYKGKVIVNKEGYTSLKEGILCKHKDIFNEIVQKEDLDFEFYLLPINDKMCKSIIYHNKRLVNSKNIHKAIKSTYNLYNEGNPLYYLNLKTAADFNISADKSEILCDNEEQVIEKLKRIIINHYNGTLHYKTSEVQGKDESYVANIYNGKRRHLVSNKDNIEIDKHNISVDNIENNMPQRKCLEKQDTYELKEMYTEDKRHDTSTEYTFYNNSHLINKNTNTVKSSASELSDTKENNNRPDYTKSKLDIFRNKSETLDSTEEEYSNGILDSPKSELPKLLELKETIFDYIKPLEDQEVNVEIHKCDFRDMKVIGQFNKGFIITTLIKGNKKFLVIVDQHAADEISNYENIKKDVRFNKQSLITPIELRLSHLEEMCLRENINVFEEYGFTIIENKLTTLPIFKNLTFGEKDFLDLLENVKNGRHELEKIHDIIASKACRSSIMIGEHLQKTKMEKIVKNLSLLDKPWKCPHGRPTFMVVKQIH